MVFSEGTITLQAAMILAFVFATLNVAHAGLSCNNDQDCGSEKWCYNISHSCVEFTKCNRYRRHEAEKPSRQSSQCGPCLPGFEEDVLGTGVTTEVCKETKKVIILATQQPDEDVENIVDWSRGSWIWGSVCLAIILLLLVGFHVLKYFRTNGHARIFEKVPFLNTARPTAPPPDEVAASSYRLHGPSYGEDDQPPIYTPPMDPNIDKHKLVNASLSCPPSGWVTKPNYDSDYNDNVADGVAMPIHSSSTSIHMELEDEGETNPSPWTPGHQTVEVPDRPFGRFAVEHQENELNNVLVRTNCRSNSTHSENTPDDGPDEPADASGSRTQGDIFCGPNVQINQTINLNIAQSVRK